MADQPEIEIPELKGLLADLRRAGDADLNDELKKAHRDSAEIIKSGALPLIPRKTGALLGSLRTTATLRGGRVAVGKAKVPYSKPVHFGWPARGIAAQPFLTESLASNRDRALDTLRDGIDRVIKKVGK